MLHFELSNLHVCLCWKSDHNERLTQYYVDLLTVTTPSLNLQVKAVLGVSLASSASNGAKKMEVTAVGEQLDTVFPDGLSKTLRYKRAAIEADR